MADILRGYGLAREQAHFKLEQEADVQRHRQRLVKEGKLSSEADAAQKDAPGQQQQQHEDFKSSEDNFEILAEVLQQQARVDDPHALRRRQYERRVKGEPAPPTEADLLRARSKMYALGAAVGHVPRMSMGRDRWAPSVQGDAADAALAGVRQLTPEAREVASRTYVAGVRALVYGSLLGAVGLGAAVTYAVHSSGITSGEELGRRMRAGLEPLSHGLRAWLLPIKERAEAWVAADPSGSGISSCGGAAGGGEAALAGEGAAAGGGTSEFSRRLQERYNPRKGAEAGGSDGAGASG